MIKRLNQSVIRKLILLAFLTAGTFFVSSRANRNEAGQINQPIANKQDQADVSTPQSIAESLADFRSTYKFVAPSQVPKKH